MKEDDKSERLPHMSLGDVCAMHTPGREIKRQNGPRFRNDGISFAILSTDRDGIVMLEKDDTNRVIVNGAIPERYVSAGYVISPEGVATTVLAGEGGTGGKKKMIEVESMEENKENESIGQEKIRIRYLTPRECLRLMGQKDEDIDKLMEIGLSKSALYKLAGNSIVVDVLEAIFKGIYVDKTFRPSRGKQVSLDQW